MLGAPVLLPTVELTLHLAGPMTPERLPGHLDQWTVWSTADAVVDNGVLRDEQVRLSRKGAPAQTVGPSPAD